MGKNKRFVYADTISNDVFSDSKDCAVFSIDAFGHPVLKR